MIDRNLNYGRHLIERFLKNSKPFIKVLDLGAGKGNDLLIAKKIVPGCKLNAVENYKPYVIQLIENDIEVHSLNIENEKLPFEDNSFDVVIMNQIMEHVKEVFWILHEVSRIVKLNGFFIVGVPNLASLHNRFLLSLGKQPTSIKNNSAHVRGYTFSDFKNLLNSGFPNGWELCDFGGSNFYPFPPPIAKTLAKLFPYMAWGIFMHWKKTKKYENGYLNYPINKHLETNFYLG